MHHSKENCSKKNYDRSFLWLGLFSAVVFLSVSSLMGEESKNESPKILRYCSEASPSAFNPQVAMDGATLDVTHSIYDRLIDFEEGGVKLVPGLAESWRVSPDGLNVTFKLRKGVKWQTTSYFTPTREFNAEDVLFTFNRMLDTSHPYHAQGAGKYEYFSSMEMDKVIKKIVAEDDHTVRFELSRPEAPILANLAMDFTSITSKEYGEKLIAEEKMRDFDYLPVGTGPFFFNEYKRGEEIVLNAHEDYFRGRPKVNQLIFDITINSSQRFEKLKKGDCHIITDPPPASIDGARSESSLQVHSQPGLNIFYLSFNVEKPPYDNILVRQAIAHAMNRSRYIREVYLGSAQLAKNPIPPNMWGYNRRVVDHSHNPSRAKELLEEAGHEEGFEMELAYITGTRPYLPDGKKMAELMKEDLEAVGIKVKLVTAQWSEYLNSVRRGEYGVFQIGWIGDNGDPDNFLNVLLSCASVEGGTNFARWCHREYSHYVGRARVTTNIRLRTQFYERAQVIFKEEVPWVTVAHATIYKMTRKEVSGYELSPLGINNFYRVSLE